MVNKIKSKMQRRQIWLTALLTFRDLPPWTLPAGVLSAQDLGQRLARALPRGLAGRAEARASLPGSVRLRSGLAPLRVVLVGLGAHFHQGVPGSWEGGGDRAHPGNPELKSEGEAVLPPSSPVVFLCTCWKHAALLAMKNAPLVRKKKSYKIRFPLGVIAGWVELQTG